MNSLADKAKATRASKAKQEFIPHFPSQSGVQPSPGLHQNDWGTQSSSQLYRLSLVSCAVGYPQGQLSRLCLPPCASQPRHWWGGMRGRKALTCVNPAQQHSCVISTASSKIQNTAPYSLYGKKINFIRVLQKEFNNSVPWEQPCLVLVWLSSSS